MEKKEKHNKFNYQYKDWFTPKLPHLVKQAIWWYEWSDIWMKYKKGEVTTGDGANFLTGYVESNL